MVVEKVSEEWRRTVEKDTMKGFAISPREIPAGEWIVQPKYDGEYTILYNTPQGAFTVNRYGKMRTAYPVTDQLEEYRPDSVFVGELITDAPTTKLPDLLRAKSNGEHLRLILFDVLQVGNDNLRQTPYFNRLAALHNIFQFQPRPAAVQIIESEMANNAEQILVLFNQCVKFCEGVMLKRPSSLWVAGRSRDWLKLKKRQTADVVVMGIAKDGERMKTGNDFGTLLVGAYDEHGTLVQLGRVSSGLGQTERAAILAAARKTATSEDKDYIYLPPRLVAEIEFQERYEDSTQWEHGAMRHPKVIRLRFDKPATDCLVNDFKEPT